MSDTAKQDVVIVTPVYGPTMQELEMVSASLWVKWSDGPKPKMSPSGCFSPRGQPQTVRSERTQTASSVGLQVFQQRLALDFAEIRSVQMATVSISRA